MGALKTIIESQPYFEARRLLEPDCRRLDEILDGVFWELARRPQDFPRMPYTDLHCLTTEAFGRDAPSLWVWYVFDKNTVTLQHIEHAEEGLPWR